MFLFLPIILLISLIQVVIKNGAKLEAPYTDTTLGLIIVFGVMPLLISILVYGSHLVISRLPRSSEAILKLTALLPYLCFVVLILPQAFGVNQGSWVLSAIYGITNNLNGLHEFILENIFFNLADAESLVLALVNIIAIFQYFCIFGTYLGLYYYFNQKGSRDYHTPILVEFIPSYRLIFLGFFLIIFFEFLVGLTLWQTNFIAFEYIQTKNEVYRFFLSTIEILIPLLFPFVMLLFFPLLLPKLAGWKILPPGPELTLLEKTANENRFKYNKIYLASNPGLVTAGVIGIFPRATNILFTKDIFNLLNEKEIEAVMLHEIGHSKYRHIVYYIFFLLLVESVILILLTTYSLGSEYETYFYIALLGLAIRFGWGWLSRQCERQADLYAAEIQGTPEHIVSSFKKISDLGHSLDKPSWHHGSLRERIANLENAFKDNGANIRKAYHRRIKTIKITILIFFVLLNGSLVFKNYLLNPERELPEFKYKYSLALNYLFQKDYKNSEKYFNEVLVVLQNPEASEKLIEGRNSRLLITYYNMACLYSLSGNSEKALEFLNKTIPLFVKDVMDVKGDALNVHKVETDPDLNSLRKLEGYLKFVEELKKIEKGFGLKSWKD